MYFWKNLFQEIILQVADSFKFSLSKARISDVLELSVKLTIKLTYYQTQNIRETYLATEYIEQRQKFIWREKVVSKRAFIASENRDKTKRALFHNVKTNGEVMNGVNQVNQQVFVKHVGFYICVYPCRLQLVKSSSRSNTEPVSEQSWQHNHSHQKENNA